MKKILFATLFSLIATSVYADRPIYYPFDVKLGGQIATPTSGVVAVIAEPISPDAELEVMVPEVKGPVFVNFFISDDKGNVAQENTQAAEVMMITTGPKALINQTMSKNPLVSGKTYLGNIVANSNTSRIVFKVK